MKSIYNILLCAFLIFSVILIIVSMKKTDKNDKKDNNNDDKKVLLQSENKKDLDNSNSIEKYNKDLYKFEIPKYTNPFSVCDKESKEYQEKLNKANKFYFFNNKPNYELTKGWNEDYTYDLCKAGKQPIDAIGYKEKKIDLKQEYDLHYSKYE